MTMNKTACMCTYYSKQSRLELGLLKKLTVH